MWITCTVASISLTLPQKNPRTAEKCHNPDCIHSRCQKCQPLPFWSLVFIGHKGFEECTYPWVSWWVVAGFCGVPA
jgi:hypothetical protein